MRLGIYGGTFAPIHNAHIRVAKAFYNQFSLDKLMIIPAGIPPHKQIAKDDSPEKRLRMCQIAFEGCKNFEISDIELKREGKSYTVMTLRELKNEETDIYMLCGTDMILSFDQWFCFDEIFRLCTLVYVRRENDPEITEKIDEKVNMFRTKYGAQIVELESETLELSSTEIREAIKNGEDVSNMIPTNVAEYIKKNRLYEGL